MINYLDGLDRQLLLLLNGEGHPFLDAFMWLYSGKVIWIPAALAFVAYFFKKGWREGLLVLLFVVLVITLCDQISSSFFKPFFERLRPGRQPVLQDMLTYVNDYRGGKYGFISSHSANSIGFATFLSLLFRRQIVSFSLFAWAFLNAYTRLYLAVHFPGDVLVGGLVGLLVGLACYLGYLYVRQNFHSRLNIRIQDPYRGKLPWLPLAVLYATVLLLGVAAPQLKALIG